MACTRTISKTEKGSIPFRTCAISRDSLSTMWRRAKANKEDRTISTRDNGKITISMGQAKVATSTSMALQRSGISVSLEMGRSTAMESIDGLMVTFIRGSGRMVR